MRELTINDEFRNLLPQLSDDEFSALEKNIVDEGGIHSPIIVWNNTIIDGHNRYAICTKNNIKFHTEERRFSNEGEVKIWIIRNQFARRNINRFVRGELALKLKNELANIGKQHMADGLENSTNLDTRLEIAKTANVSDNTIHRVEKILSSGNEDLIKKCREGEATVNEAYKSLKAPSDMAQSGAVQTNSPVPSKVIAKLRNIAENANEIRDDLSDDDKDDIRSVVEILNDVAPPLEEGARLAETPLESVNAG